MRAECDADMEKVMLDKRRIENKEQDYVDQIYELNV